MESNQPPFNELVGWMEALLFSPESTAIRTGGLRFASSTLRWGSVMDICGPPDVYHPQAPMAPQAVQNSQPSFLITAELPHSLHSMPWISW